MAGPWLQPQLQSMKTSPSSSLCNDPTTILYHHDCMTRSYQAKMLTRLFAGERALKKRPPKVNMAIENNVYLAKLAEQAERYEGMLFDSLIASTVLT